MTDRPYRICTRCLMDTSDPDIAFDENGVCNHCHKYDRMVAQHTLSGPAAAEYVSRLTGEIRAAGRGKPYDCVIGISGGVDSTYIAYRAKELGLRPLAVHLDNGWDSELAVKNIEETLKRLQIDLHTQVLDWDEFKRLQIAFLRSGTPDLEVPSDHAIWAAVADTAERIGVRYIITGSNVRTESHLPRAWSDGHFDWGYIRGIARRFGAWPLRSYPHENLVRFYARMWRLQRIGLLDYLDYDKAEAMRVLTDRLGWRYYGSKHHESIYTRFYQGYILPARFGYDKRRVHLSSLICSGQMTRAEALASLEEPAYAPAQQEEDRAYVAKKLDLSEEEFEAILRLPRRSFRDYPSYARILTRPPVSTLYDLARSIQRRRQARRLGRAGGAKDPSEE